ncbi:MAG TPA: AbrB/MazE/SpoVT family DNA-binding domain-containing protein [Candidatus Koribacter sp.]|jgi:antitoxin MazE
MRAQMLKWGNSLAVRIPKVVAEQAKLSEGDALELEVSQDGTVQLQRVGKVPSLAQLVAQITPENRYEETDWGADIGREKVEW